MDGVHGSSRSIVGLELRSPTRGHHSGGMIRNRHARVQIAVPVSGAPTVENKLNARRSDVKICVHAPCMVPNPKPGNQSNLPDRLQLTPDRIMPSAPRLSLINGSFAETQNSD